MFLDQVYLSLLRYRGEKTTNAASKRRTGAFGSAASTRSGKRLANSREGRKLRRPAMTPAFARDGFVSPESYFDHHATPGHSNPMFDSRITNRDEYASTVSPVMDEKEF